MPTHPEAVLEERFSSDAKLLELWIPSRRKRSSIIEARSHCPHALIRVPA
jgi:hypothetical protein